MLIFLYNNFQILALRGTVGPFRSLREKAAGESLQTVRPEAILEHPESNSVDTGGCSRYLPRDAPIGKIY